MTQFRSEAIMGENYPPLLTLERIDQLPGTDAFDPALARPTPQQDNTEYYALQGHVQDGNWNFVVTSFGNTKPVLVAPSVASESIDEGLLWTPRRYASAPVAYRPLRELMQAPLDQLQRGEFLAAERFAPTLMGEGNDGPAVTSGEAYDEWTDSPQLLFARVACGRGEFGAMVSLLARAGMPGSEADQQALILSLNQQAEIATGLLQLPRREALSPERELPFPERVLRDTVARFFRRREI